MPLDSPRPVERFFGADARGDIDAIVALFTDDAVVVDERQTWQGRDGIRQWQHGPAARYEYTTELENVSRTGENRYRASGRIAGNFPGGTASSSGASRSRPDSGGTTCSRSLPT